MAQTMTAADSAWLHMDSRTNLMVINAVLWFDEPLDWERVRATFMERVVERFPRFRRRVREGLPGRPPAWCDDSGFDPDLHFHRLALPAIAAELGPAPPRATGARLRREGDGRLPGRQRDRRRSAAAGRRLPGRAAGAHSYSAAKWSR